MADDAKWMGRALELADCAGREHEVPIGAVLVKDNVEIAGAWNSPIGSNDPTAHAEINTLRAAAAAIGNYRLPGTTLYVTVEPCVMCVGAIVHARVTRVVFGAREPKTGAAGSVFNLLDSELNHHRPVGVGGVMADESRARLQAFFATRRAAG